MRRMKEVQDEQWFDLNLTPENSSEVLGFSLPTLPPENIQKGFTGSAGKETLEKAFWFYKYVRDNYLHSEEPNIMDFGAGWGRIMRFFLKETAHENLFAVDTFSVAIDWMKKTNFSCNIIHSNPLPPIPNIGEGVRFDLIYSYSVFSHLSEEYFLKWINYLLSLVKDDGVIVFTTRGNSFIDHIEKHSVQKQMYQDYSKLREQYQNGDFLFFKDRSDSGELAGSFFGEAFIPKQYLEKMFPQQLVDFTESVQGTNQAVVVLKPKLG